MEMSINDAWFRDTGATFLVNGKGDKAATDWHFNAYGGLVDGLYFPWDKELKSRVKWPTTWGFARIVPTM